LRFGLWFGFGFGSFRGLLGRRGCNIFRSGLLAGTENQQQQRGQRENTEYKLGNANGAEHGFAALPQELQRKLANRVQQEIPERDRAFAFCALADDQPERGKDECAPDEAVKEDGIVNRIRFLSIKTRRGTIRAKRTLLLDRSTFDQRSCPKERTPAQAEDPAQAGRSERRT
jgi:hypothetical protein